MSSFVNLLKEQVFVSFALIVLEFFEFFFVIYYIYYIYLILKIKKNTLYLGLLDFNNGLCCLALQAFNLKLLLLSSWKYGSFVIKELVLIKFF